MAGRPKQYPYAKRVPFTANTQTLLERVSKARGNLPVAELIREYVDHGLARDVARYALHLYNEETPDE